MADRLVLPALILQSYETGNSSEVVHVLTPEHGRLSVFARGLKSSKRSLGAVMQPLAVVELTIQQSPGAATANLIDAVTLMDPGPIVSDFERFGLGSLLAEAASRCCEEGNAAPELFRAVLEGLSLLDPRSGETAPTATARAMVHILEVAGYEPNFEDEVLRPWPADKAKPRVFWLEKETGRLHLEGVQPREEPKWPFAVPAKEQQLPLPAPTVRFLYDLRQGMLRRLEDAHAQQLIEALIHFLEWHLEGNLRCAAFWRETHGLLNGDRDDRPVKNSPKRTQHDE